MLSRHRRNSGKLFSGSGGGKQNPVHAIFSVGGELLTSTESIVRRWKEYYKDLLNPTNMDSKEETELENLGLGSSITGVKVAETVKQLRSSSTPGDR